MTPLIAGNWKMHGSQAATDDVRAIGRGLATIKGEGGRVPDVLICPPATLVAHLAEAARESGVALGGQDCHWNVNGAHTGDISAEMLAEAGAAWCIVGHSERRADHGERDDTVREKAEAALRAGLTPIVCVGEKLGERDAGRAEDVVCAQLERSMPTKGDVVVAYEPVWAIGTGRTPSSDDIASMHAALRSVIGTGPRILYGGSVKPSNATEILAIDEVDGALVGGASLKPEDFLGIIRAA